MPPIPPKSKYFAKRNGETFVYLPNGQLWHLDLVPMNWNFVVAAIAMVEWNESFGEVLTPEEMVKMRSVYAEWKKWRDR